jgi:hypothetical protein
MAVWRGPVPAPQATPVRHLRDALGSRVALGVPTGARFIRLGVSVSSALSCEPAPVPVARDGQPGVSKITVSMAYLCVFRVADGRVRPGSRAEVVPPGPGHASGSL